MTADSPFKPSLDEYKQIVGEEKIDEIKLLAEKLSGRRICHVNSTSHGGGVAEILNRLVPLMKAAGLDADWHVIKGSNEFFKVTKSLHNGLQGMPIELTDQMKKTYLLFNEINAKELELHEDFVVIHDPQPASIITYYRPRTGKWIWRCHIDSSNPNKTTLDFLIPFILQYDAQIFTLNKFVPELLKEKNVAIIPPSIDPLGAKNSVMSDSAILSILNKYDVEADKPILTQVARFDAWKDPIGAIDVYRIIKKRFPTLQLLLIGIMAPDDPEGIEQLEKTARHAGEDDDIHLLTDLNGVRDTEVNAFQRASDVVLQMSKREGFGLTVTEALWKGIPVVGRNSGGIPLQVINGETGFLVDGVQEAADKAQFLLEHPEDAKRMGAKAKEHVRQNFLITRHLEDYVKLFEKL